MEKNIKVKNNDFIFSLVKKFFVYWVLFKKRILIELSSFILYKSNKEYNLNYVVFVLKKILKKHLLHVYVLYMYVCTDAYIKFEKYVYLLKNKMVVQWVDFLIKYFTKISKYYMLFFIKKRKLFIDFLLMKSYNSKFLNGIFFKKLLVKMRHKYQKKNSFVFLLIDKLKWFFFSKYFNLNQYTIHQFFLNYLRSGFMGYRGFLHNFFGTNKDMFNRLFFLFKTVQSTDEHFNRFLFKTYDKKNFKLRIFSVQKFSKKILELKMFYKYFLNFLLVDYSEKVRFFKKQMVTGYRKKNLFFYKNRIVDAYKFMVRIYGFNKKSLLNKDFLFYRKNVKKGVDWVEKMLTGVFFISKQAPVGRARHSIKGTSFRLRRTRAIQWGFRLSKKYRASKIFAGMYLRLRYLLIRALGRRKVFKYRRNLSRPVYYKFRKILAQRHRFGFLFNKQGKIYKQLRFKERVEFYHTHHSKNYYKKKTYYKKRLKNYYKMNIYNKLLRRRLSKKLKDLCLMRKKKLIWKVLNLVVVQNINVVLQRLFRVQSFKVVFLIKKKFEKYGIFRINKRVLTLLFRPFFDYFAHSFLFMLDYRFLLIGFRVMEKKDSPFKKRKLSKVARILVLFFIIRNKRVKKFSKLYRLYKKKFRFKKTLKKAYHYTQPAYYKKKVKKKRSELAKERRLALGYIYKPEIFIFFRRTVTNLFWTAVDFFGNVLLWMSIGRIGFRGAALRTEHASKKCGEEFGRRLRVLSLNTKVKFSIFIRFRKNRAIKDSFYKMRKELRIRFKRVYVNYLYSHNGLRKKKKKRR